jgi:nucleotide-binding universal stress UspA family protein
VQEELTEQAIADEARKGYGFLVIGVEAAALVGEINEKVARIAAAFEGPFAIAVARGQHRTAPAGDSHLDILVPVTGTGHSRRGAEVALALARASLGSVTVLHVARRRHPSDLQGLRRFRAAWRGAGDNEHAILQDAVRLGDQFGVPVRTAVRTADAEDAILRQLKTGQHNLIAMGVSQRPGTTLFFGGAAAAVLERSEVSILFVAG